VATTSTRSASALSADIQRVLGTLGVQYRPLRGGFECVHSPSIDLASIVPATGLEKRPSIKRKSSKLSISLGKKEKTDEVRSVSCDARPTAWCLTTIAVKQTSPPPAQPDATVSPSALSLGRPSSPSSLPLSPPVSPSKASAHRIPATATDQHDSATDDEADIWGTSPTRTTTMGRRSSAAGGGGGLASGVNGGGMSEMVVRFEIMVIKVCPELSLPAWRDESPAKPCCHASSTGALAAAARRSIPSRRRQRVAVPDAGQAYPDRAQALSVCGSERALLSIKHNPFTSSPLRTRLSPFGARPAHDS